MEKTQLSSTAHARDKETETKKIPLFKDAVAKQPFKYKKFKYNLKILQNKSERNQKV